MITTDRGELYNLWFHPPLTAQGSNDLTSRIQLHVPCTQARGHTGMCTSTCTCTMLLSYMYLATLDLYSLVNSYTFFPTQDFVPMVLQLYVNGMVDCF